MIFTKPEDALDYYKQLLDKHGELGLRYVAYGDEDMLPGYPAAKVAAGPLQKELHGTHKWLNTFQIDIWVYHAKLSVGHATRSKEDLELASAIRGVVHSDMTCSGGVIQGWIVLEQPALITRSKGTAVVGTRMTWSGRQVETF